MSKSQYFIIILLSQLISSPLWGFDLLSSTLVRYATLSPGGLCQLPTLGQVNQTIPLLNNEVYVGDYKADRLFYGSFQLKDFQFQKELAESRFQLVSFGIGYRRLTAPFQWIGIYGYLDGSPLYNYLNINLGLESIAHLWTLSFNTYLPCAFPAYELDRTPKPQVLDFNLNNQTVEQTYYPEKGNFGFDFKITRAHTFLNNSTPSAGLYYFWDRYSQQHLLGGSLGIDYKLSAGYSFSGKYTFDSARRHTVSINLTWHPFGQYASPHTAITQNFCLPNHRHLSPRFLPIKMTKKTTTLSDKEQWEAKYLECNPSLSNVEKAYRFFSLYDGRALDKVKKIMQKGTDSAKAKQMIRELRLKLHPDKNPSQDEKKFTKLFQAFDNYKEILINTKIY